MVGVKFQIYGVHITGKCICQIFTTPLPGKTLFLSLTPRQTEVTHPSRHRFSENLFPQQRKGAYESYTLHLL